MLIGLLAALIAAAWVYSDARALAGRGIRVGGTSWKPLGWAAASFRVMHSLALALRLTAPAL